MQRKVKFMDLVELFNVKSANSNWHIHISMLMKMHRGSLSKTNYNGKIPLSRLIFESFTRIKSIYHTTTDFCHIYDIWLDATIKPECFTLT